MDFPVSNLPCSDSLWSPFSRVAQASVEILLTLGTLSSTHCGCSRPRQLSRRTVFSFVELPFVLGVSMKGQSFKQELTKMISCVLELRRGWLVGDCPVRQIPGPVSLLSTWHKLQSSEKREPHGENASRRWGCRQACRAFS